MKNLVEEVTKLSLELRKYDSEKSLQVKVAIGLRQIEEAVAEARAEYWKHRHKELSK